MFVKDLIKIMQRKEDQTTFIGSDFVFKRTCRFPFNAVAVSSVYDNNKSCIDLAIANGNGLMTESEFLKMLDQGVKDQSSSICDYTRLYINGEEIVKAYHKDILGVKDCLVLITSKFSTRNNIPGR